MFINLILILFIYYRTLSGISILVSTSGDPFGGNCATTLRITDIISSAISELITSFESA